MIGPPANDPEFLGTLNSLALADSQHPVFQELAAKMSLGELVWLIRSLPFRWDLGDPNDGPRVPGNPSQRLRRLPRDVNCTEATRMYLGLAECIAPEIYRTSATLRLDGGYHTFPVENGRPVVLDPIMPRNAMAATVDYCTGKRIDAPVCWILDIARHGANSRAARRGLDELTRAVFGHQHIQARHHIEALLAIAREQAELWGDAGNRAYQRAEHEIRHFMTLDSLLLEAR